MVPRRGREHAAELYAFLMLVGASAVVRGSPASGEDDALPGFLLWLLGLSLLFFHHPLRPHARPPRAAGADPAVARLSRFFIFNSPSARAVPSRALRDQELTNRLLLPLCAAAG
ncbi:hypothetical protein E2562_037563 [Oryza meyeriana var. granulata]|uniref:Uncharacterized protein n=1 Tax=Oryza meyeriana var. granulata TaxID=110450 RepID=A0A6G1E706_9ORYZ|nr:hypothetical protein E2562_037563 [Oryza meyeriana var. granulata]